MSSAPSRKELRRNEILDAAERIFADNGYHETGIADIAEDLGIGHGTFYRYFKNKHDIAVNVMERVTTRMAAAGLSEDPTAANSLEDYRAQTARILGGMLDFAQEHPNLTRFFQQQAMAVDSERLSQVLDQYAVFTEAFLRNGLDKGFLREDLDVQCTAQALVSLIFEGMRRVLTSDDDEMHRRWIDAGMALMFDGVRRR